MIPLTLPNVLTVLRILLVPVLVVALLGNTPSGDVLAERHCLLSELRAEVDSETTASHHTTLDEWLADGAQPPV